INVILFYFFLVDCSYVNGVDLPGINGWCDAEHQIDIKIILSCDMCAAACLKTTTTFSRWAKTSEYVICKCCEPKSTAPYDATVAATTEISRPFLSFSLFLSFMLNRLFD
ncbi:hypothetical protein MKX03_017708, partial [Papaver bracteatum]